MSENRFYNYVYLDPSKPGEYVYHTENRTYSFQHEPFYIGKGTGKRYLKHYQLCTGSFMKNKMKKLLDSNIKPLILLIESHDENQALTNETLLIKLIGRRNLKNGPLVNLTDGGTGTRNYIVSEETKRKISVFNKNKKLSEEHIQKIVLSKLGKKRGKMSDIWKSKISKANKGKSKPPRSIEHIKNLKISCAKNAFNKVIQYDLQNNFIREWDNAIDPAVYYGKSYSSIRSACNGWVKTCAKFKWSYKK